VERSSYRFEHAASVFDYVIVPESQDTEASAPKTGIAFPVGFIVGMLTAVGFDDQ